MSIQKIEVIGPGCPKCKALETSAKDAVARLGLSCEVAKVSDMGEIIQRGVMSTPALAVDGRIVSTGRALSAAEVEKLLQSGAAQ
ncbi:MAG: thioredoxin family protein [Phycisphaerales bacterium]